MMHFLMPNYKKQQQQTQKHFFALQSHSLSTSGIDLPCMNHVRRDSPFNGSGLAVKCNARCYWRRNIGSKFHCLRILFWELEKKAEIYLSR